MGIRYPGRARIDPMAPQALGICDRCGFQYNLRDLDWQWGWNGPNLINLHILVCEECMDDPSDQLRSIVLPIPPTIWPSVDIPPEMLMPPDPPPLYIDVRPENFALDEKNYLNLKPIVGQPSMFVAVSGMGAELLAGGKIIEAADFEDTSAMAAALQQGHLLQAVMSATSALQGQFQGTVPIEAALGDTGDMAALVSHGMRVAPTLADTSALTASLQYTGGMFAEMAGTGQLAASLSLDARLAATLGDTSAMAGTASLSFIAVTPDDSNLTTYSFAGQSLGAEDSTRRIVVVVHWDDSIDTRTLSSVTIAGVGATIHRQGNGGATGCAIASALVPTGTSGTISFTLSGAADRGAIGVYRAINEVNSSPHDTELDIVVSSGLLSVAIDIPAGGWVVAGVDFRGATGQSFTWTGLNEQYDTAYGDAAAVYRTGGFQSGLGVQTGRTVSAQCTSTAAANGTLVAISWN